MPSQAPEKRGVAIGKLLTRPLELLLGVLFALSWAAMYIRDLFRR